MKKNILITDLIEKKTKEINSEVNHVIKELEYEIENKDNELSILKNRISTLIDSNKRLKNKNKEYSEELEVLLSELNIYKKFKSLEQDIIIINKLNEIFDYPIDVIERCLTKLNMEKYSFLELFDFLEAAVNYRHVEIIDEIIFNITDFKIDINSEGLHASDVGRLFKIIEKFMKIQLESCKYSYEGIDYLLSKIIELGWIQLIREFIEKNFDKLESIVFNIKEYDFEFRYLLNILKTYILMDDITKANSWITNILFNIDLENIALKLDEEINFLFIVIAYHKDDEIIDKLPDGINLLKTDFTEIKIYHNYHDLLQKGDLSTQHINEFKEFYEQSIKINDSIKDKILEKLVNNLQDMIKLKNENNKRITNKEISNNLEVVEKIVMIKMKEDKCPYDNSKLLNRKCKLNYYSNKKKKNVEGSIEMDLLYCPQCQRWYINQQIKNGINIKSNKLNIATIDRNSKKKIANKSQDTIHLIPSRIHNSNNVEKEMGKVKDIKGASYYPSYSGINSNEKKQWNNEDDNKLKDESDLRKLGYNTKLSKEERWNILRNKAIPILGKEKTMSHINFLIRFNKGKTDRDFSHAIDVWENDLKRLKQYKK